MDKIIIFGAGYLGNRISKEYKCSLVSRQEVDLLSPLEISKYLKTHNPDVVINWAGKTNGPGETGVDWCEKNKSESIQGNVVAPVNLSIACQKNGIYFIHLGSGCMYWGENNGAGFSEADEPNFYGPQFYAKTKIDSERILKNLPGLLLRLRMPIDDRPHPRNLIDKLRKYPQVIDAQNSMTTLPDMIATLQELIKTRQEGVYNMVNPGTICAAEIMEMYCEIVDPTHSFSVMSIDKLDKITLGKKPNCTLDPKRLREDNLSLPPIKEAVRNCLIKYSEALKT